MQYIYKNTIIPLSVCSFLFFCYCKAHKSFYYGLYCAQSIVKHWWVLILFVLFKSVPLRWINKKKTKRDRGEENIVARITIILHSCALSIIVVNP